MLRQLTVEHGKTDRPNTHTVLLRIIIFATQASSVTGVCNMYTQVHKYCLHDSTFKMGAVVRLSMKYCDTTQETLDERIIINSRFLNTEITKLCRKVENGMGASCVILA